MDLKDNVLKKLNTTNLFSITYRKDKFAISDKEYPIGYTSFLVMDTDSRFIDESIFEDLKNFTEELLNKDFNRTDFLNYRAKIISVIDVLSQYEIFKIFDIKKCKEIINEFFTEEKINLYEEYERFTKNEYRIKISEKLDELVKASVDLETAFLIGFFISSAVKEVKYYSSVVFQITNKIVKNNARTKAELAEAFSDFINDPYMNFIFDVNSHPFGTRATIIPVVESENGTSKIYRKVYYNNLKDFLMTDLLEGYIHGHHLWRCDICDRYFFMTTARNQLYCSTVNKKYGVPCSYIAKHPEVTKRKMKKQRKSDSPYYVLWKNRYDSIRKNKSLSKYSANVSAKAKELIDYYFNLANVDFDYAENQYEKDMELSKIYEEAMKD